MDILVLNFGHKFGFRLANVRGEGVISDPKDLVSNLRKLMHVRKICNGKFWNESGGVKGRLDFSWKFIHFGNHKRP